MVIFFENYFLDVKSRKLGNVKTTKLSNRLNA